MSFIHLCPNERLLQPALLFHDLGNLYETQKQRKSCAQEQCAEDEGAPVCGNKLERYKRS